MGIALVLALATISTPAQKKGDLKLAEKTTVDGQVLVLNGKGVHTEFFVDDYVGALYLPSKQADADAILATDGPRCMVIHFIYSLDVAKMSDTWRGGLRDNVSNPPPDVAAAFDQLVTWTGEVYDDSEITLTYTPGYGTIVKVDGATLGILPGKNVADAILSTWIGPKPSPGPAFKKGILGK